MLTCPSKYLIGIDCPGCGLQRSIAALCGGHIADSFALYPATIPMIITLIFTVLHICFKFKYGATLIKYAYILTATIVTVFYVYKIINNKLL